MVPVCLCLVLLLLLLYPTYCTHLSVIFQNVCSVFSITYLFVCPPAIFTWSLNRKVRLQGQWQTEPQEVAEIQCFSYSDLLPVVG